jgi:hypothetical protein
VRSRSFRFRTSCLLILCADKKQRAVLEASKQAEAQSTERSGPRRAPSMNRSGQGSPNEQTTSQKRPEFTETQNARPASMQPQNARDREPENRGHLHPGGRVSAPSPVSSSPQTPLYNPPSPIMPIHIPDTGDAAMQKFFHDIVDQLQTMSIHSGGAPISVPNTPAVSPGPTFTEPAQSPFVPSWGEEDQERFADAETDDTMVYDKRTVSLPPPRRSDGSSQASRQTYGGRSPQISVPPLAIRKSNGPQRNVVRSAPPRPVVGRGGRVPPPTPEIERRMVYDSSDKENRGGRRALQMGGGGGNKRATLGLAIQDAGMPETMIDGGYFTSEPKGRKAGGNIYCLEIPPCVVTEDIDFAASRSPRFTPSPIFSSATDDANAPAKSSWFASLFNWKHQLVCIVRFDGFYLLLVLKYFLQSYTLLSTETITPTRAECSRILENLGVVVTIENADGNAVLKCRVDELHGWFGFLPFSTHESDIRCLGACRTRSQHSC